MDVNTGIRSAVRKVINLLLAPLGLVVFNKNHLTETSSDQIYQSLPDAVEEIYIEDADKLTVKAIMPRIHRTVMEKTYWFGVQTLKNPCDVWIYQQLIYKIRPDVIVEIGTRFGGSALTFAHMFDLLGHGRVISVDIDLSDVHDDARSHPRITMLEGDACEMEPEVRKLVAESDRVLVIEDSSHTYENTINVLRKYSSYVDKDSYFIVEDSVSRHGWDGGFSRGPYDAVETFTAETDEFIVDREQERFFVTFNPRGFLKRVKG